MSTFGWPTDLMRSTTSQITMDRFERGAMAHQCRGLKRDDIWRLVHEPCWKWARAWLLTNWIELRYGGDNLAPRLAPLRFCPDLLEVVKRQQLQEADDIVEDSRRMRIRRLPQGATTIPLSHTGKCASCLRYLFIGTMALHLCDYSLLSWRRRLEKKQRGMLLCFACVVAYQAVVPAGRPLSCVACMQYTAKWQYYVFRQDGTVTLSTGNTFFGTMDISGYDQQEVKDVDDYIADRGIAGLVESQWNTGAILMKWKGCQMFGSNAHKHVA